MQITKDHNNAKNISSFLCPFSIDSWWKTSMVIIFQVEIKNNKEKTWWTRKVHNQTKIAYILSSPSWKFLKILQGGIIYELHWSAFLQLMFLQPTLVCINVLGNTPFHNHIQATLTSKVAFNKIMEYQILFAKSFTIQRNKVNFNPIVCPQLLYLKHRLKFFPNNQPFFFFSFWLWFWMGQRWGVMQGQIPMILISKGGVKVRGFSI
jgi:hypothetical protein